MTSRAGLNADTADRLSRMCADLEELGEMPDPRYALTLRRLRGGEQTEEDVRTALDDLEEVLRAHGLTGAGSVARGGPPADYRPLPGLGAGQPLEEVYVCPRDLCARVEIPRVAAPPECAVWAGPLALFRMDR
jgi:hypothetical protein